MAIYKTHQLDKVFHALGDSTRRQMLAMLSRGQTLSASELAAPFDISQPSVSKHLKVLEESLLVERLIEGRTHNFRLRPEHLGEANTWLVRHTAFWAGSLGRLSRYAAIPSRKEKT